MWWKRQTKFTGENGCDKVTNSELKTDQSQFLILCVIVYEQKQSLEW